MRARGYTLVELMIAMTISLIGVAAGMTLLIGTQHWFQSGVDDRGLQESGRIALDEVASNVVKAGYGMEPGMTFDMGVLTTTIMDRLPPADRSLVRFGGYNCPTGSCPGLRDSITGPDELVFYTRDIEWARDVTVVGVNTITLAAPASGATEPLLPGQVLQLMCYGKSNQWLWAYVSVAAAQVQSSGDMQVTLQAGPGQPYDFPYQNAVLGESCFLNPTPPPAATVRAFKIDRYRYHVAAIAEDGTVAAWGTPGARPYLMLEQGLSDADGVLIDRAVAPDVEDLQLAYVFPLAHTSGTLGADPGVHVLADVAGLESDVGAEYFNLNPLPPFVIPSFATAPTDVDLSLTSHHPANIRAVRIAVTVRTARKDIGVADAVVPASLNRPDQPGEAGYRRMTFESTVYTHNLEARAPVFPVYDSQAYLNQCKAAGCVTEPCARATTGNCGGG